MNRKLNVYLHPNGDGLHSFLVAAPNQRRAVELIGTTLGDFRRYGGRSISEGDWVGLALANPEIVFTRAIPSAVLPGDPNPWTRVPFQRAESCER
jgi:hypothetical protein